MDTETLTQERKRVLDLYEAGWSVREIAKALNISTQRAYQQLKKLDVPSPTKRTEK